MFTLKCRKSTAIFMSPKYLVSSVSCLGMTFLAYGARWHMSSNGCHKTFSYSWERSAFDKNNLYNTIEQILQLLSLLQVQSCKKLYKIISIKILEYRIIMLACLKLLHTLEICSLTHTVLQREGKLRKANSFKKYVWLIGLRLGMGGVVE